MTLSDSLRCVLYWDHLMIPPKICFLMIFFSYVSVWCTSADPLSVWAFLLLGTHVMDESEPVSPLVCLVSLVSRVPCPSPPGTLVGVAEEEQTPSNWRTGREKIWTTYSLFMSYQYDHLNNSVYIVTKIMLSHKKHVKKIKHRTCKIVLCIVKTHSVWWWVWKN